MEPVKSQLGPISVAATTCIVTPEWHVDAREVWTTKVVKRTSVSVRLKQVARNKVVLCISRLDRGHWEMKESVRNRFNSTWVVTTLAVFNKSLSNSRWIKLIFYRLRVQCVSSLASRNYRCSELNITSVKSSYTEYPPSLLSVHFCSILHCSLAFFVIDRRWWAGLCNI